MWLTWQVYQSKLHQNLTHSFSWKGEGGSNTPRAFMLPFHVYLFHFKNNIFSHAFWKSFHFSFFSTSRKCLKCLKGRIPFRTFRTNYCGQLHIYYTQYIVHYKSAQNKKKTSPKTNYGKRLNTKKTTWNHTSIPQNTEQP